LSNLSLLKEGALDYITRFNQTSTSSKKKDPWYDPRIYLRKP